MLRSLREVLEWTSGAVGSFNVVDPLMALAVVSAAVQEGRPAIVGVATRHWEKMDAPVMVPSIRSIVERSSAAVALHLDHAKPSQLTIIREALDLGFTSVMIDGSTEPFEQNCAITEEVLKLAGRYGAGVEAELGAIAGEEGVAGLVDSHADESLYTDPGMAEAFVSRCEIDALAVSVGTAHGLYKAEPKLQLDLVSELARRVSVPLVLHGATGVPNSAIIESVERGVRKINYFSGLLVEAMDEVRTPRRPDDTDYLGFRRRLYERWKDDAAEKIRLYAGIREVGE